MNFSPDKEVTVTHLSYFQADRGIGVGPFQVIFKAVDV